MKKNITKKSWVGDKMNSLVSLLLGLATRTDGDTAIFTIRVSMRKRWVPHFLGMLKYMERLGGVGASRKLTFYSDGDGDFRPRFEFDDRLPIRKGDDMKFEERHYDAG